jgi:hypothetical protein
MEIITLIISEAPRVVAGRMLDLARWVGESSKVITY